MRKSPARNQSKQLTANQLTRRQQPLKELVERARGVGIPPEEVRQIQKVVKKHRPPPDVLAVEVDFDLDWTGDPAARIHYFVEDDWHPSDEKIARLSRFADAVQNDLLKVNNSYWPFIDFRVPTPE